MKNQSLLNIKMSRYIIPFIIIFLTAACKQSEYDKLVKEEMSKEVVHDSLFLGMTFGITKQDFFDECWKLNSKGLVTHGPDNRFVSYTLPMKEGDDTTNRIRMLFYGLFDDNKVMTGMKLQFSYHAWSLWNKSKQSDKLVPIVMDTLRKWYPGNDFLKVNSKNTQEDIYVKVDGNRRILISPIDDVREVKVIIDDLRYILDK